MRITEIFTPSDFPTYTYVEREADGTESRLREALATPGEIVSVSGPSKSGKTVLIEKVAGRDNLITVTGAGIVDAGQIWEKALDWMEAPTSQTTTIDTGIYGEISGTVKGSAGIPVIASVAAEGSGTAGASRSKSVAQTSSRRGLQQVVRDIGGSSYVLLIDDFHYMSPSIQMEVAKQIKEAARLGVKICTASVPHRSDDVVRSNPELRGRIRAVDTSPWNREELLKIGALGFPVAGIRVPLPTLRQFAVEASGSPQLMQAICLQSCFTIGLRESTLSVVDRDITEVERVAALEETSTRSDFASLLRAMHAGPKIRGTERKEFQLSDGTRGDVYRALLLAMRADPPNLSFQWNELSKRVQTACRPDSPQAASLSTACAQIARMAREMYPSQRVVDWDGDPSNLLSVEDPYFLFYIRWSNKLAELAKRA